MKLERTHGASGIEGGESVLPRAAAEIHGSSEQTSGSRRWLHLMVSLALHGALFYAAYAVAFITPPPEEILPKTELKMDMVMVRLPKPEPVGGQEGGGPPVEEAVEKAVARPRALARRTLRSNVTRQTEVAQREVTQVTPNPVFGEVTKVQVQPQVMTSAPKEIRQRVVDSATTVAPLEIAQPTQTATVMSTETPQLRRTENTPTVTSGPRLTQASSPTPVQTAGMDYQAPNIAEGVIGEIAQPGDVSGPKVRSLDSGSGTLYGVGGGGSSGRGSGNGNGNGNGFGRGSGNGAGTGDGNGGGKDCNSDPVCSRYLEMIRQRVYARWTPSRDTPGGKVQLSFRFDQSGMAHGIRVVKSENQNLGASCMDAFRHAIPFPPPPPSIAYMLDQNLIATFDFADAR